MLVRGYEKLCGEGQDEPKFPADQTERQGGSAAPAPSPADRMTWPFAARLRIIDAGDSKVFHQRGWQIHAIKTDLVPAASRQLLRPEPVHVLHGRAGSPGPACWCCFSPGSTDDAILLFNARGLLTWVPTGLSPGAWLRDSRFCGPAALLPGPSFAFSPAASVRPGLASLDLPANPV